MSEPKKVKLTREELEKIIKICESVEKRGLDPFTVNVKELLSTLRKALEENQELDHYVLDAETMYKIAAIIALQHKWLRDSAQALFVDAQLIGTKLLAADKKSIVRAFLKAWRPIISLEQVTFQRLKQGIDYFLGLPPRSGERVWGWKISDREVELLKAKLAAEEDVDEKIRMLHQELLREYESRGEIDYWDFIRRGDFEESFERAYLLSFLITEGFVDVKRNPLKNEIKLIPRREKAERKRPSSLVIVIGGEAR